MGRPRKPTALHELQGTYVNHPERKLDRALEPKPQGALGDPPESFKDRPWLQAIWAEVVAQVPPGVLTFSDRIHVEMTCRLIYSIRHGTAKSGDYSRLEALLGKMAMNPADRSKVNISPSSSVPSHERTRSNTFRDLAAEGDATTVN